MNQLMHQTAPFPQALAGLVSCLMYRPGWRFHLSDIDRDTDASGEVVGKGLTLDITTLGRNSYKVSDGETYRVHHYFIVPAATYDERAWTRWLFDRLVDVETRTNAWSSSRSTDADHMHPHMDLEIIHTQ
jgi:hypothetical protein